MVGLLIAPYAITPLGNSMATRSGTVARIRLRAAAPAIVEEAGRHAGRQRRMGMPSRWKTSGLLGSRRANAATNRSSAANQPLSGRSSVVDWLRRRTPALHASGGAVRGHVPAGRRHGRVRSCSAPSRPTAPPRALTRWCVARGGGAGRGGARASGAGRVRAPAGRLCVVRQILRQAGSRRRGVPARG